MDQQFKEELLSKSTRGGPDFPRSPLSTTTLDDEDEDQFDCHENDSFDIVTEGWKLLHIALPTVTLQVSVFSLFPQTASAIGRKLGSEALAAFSLATLVGNITCLSILIGTLSATETLQPRAFALGNYSEVGKIAIRATFVCTLLLLPFVLALALWTESILVYLGQDATASRLAKEWVRIYLCGLPATIIFRVTQRYLGAQHIVWPMYRPKYSDRMHPSSQCFIGTEARLLVYGMQYSLGIGCFRIGIYFATIPCPTLDYGQCSH
eukprot:scaffold39961_cov52-Attheya_sp.AAC.4